VALREYRVLIASNGNIGIGTATPITILDIYKSSYTGPLLCLDTGVVSAGAGVLPQSIGKPLLRLGKLGYSQTTGDYYGIGFGYAPAITDFNCAEIGTLITSTSGNETGDLVFSTRPNVTNVAATERLRIASNGIVTINANNSAGCRLVLVNEYDNINSSFRIDSSGNNDTYSLNISSYVSGAGEVGWRFRVKSVVGGNNTAIQIANTGSVYFAVGSSSASDSRIKKDIEDISDDTALTKLLLIQPKTYNYIADERNKGFGKVYGFIAQQIREVIPEAITIINKETIPNIYKSCLINNKREVYHSIPLDTPIDTSVKIDSDSYKIKEIYEDYFVIDNDIDADEVFVFGYSVEDFHTLNKDYIFTLNVCATQELHRRIEAQSLLLKSQDDRIKDLETKMERILSGTA
jgi:hypothetical protein